MSAVFNEADEVYYQVPIGLGFGKGVVQRVTETVAVVQIRGFDWEFDRQSGEWVEADGSPTKSPRIMHPTETLDRKWHGLMVDKASRNLSVVADYGEPHEIRAAFKAWDDLEGAIVMNAEGTQRGEGGQS